MWFARKTRGPVGKVARLALDQNPPELIDPVVMRVHYGDPDDRARAYNQGYDDAWEHAREVEAIELGRLNTERLAQALAIDWPQSFSPQGYGDPRWKLALARRVASEYARLTRQLEPVIRQEDWDQVADTSGLRRVGEDDP